MRKTLRKHNVYVTAKNIKASSGEIMAMVLDDIFKPGTRDKLSFKFRKKI